MALRIGCDLDGTVADMAAALQREAETLFGPGVDISPGQVLAAEPTAESDSIDPAEVLQGSGPSPQPAGPTRRALTGREYKQLWSHVRKVDNFWCTLKELEPGAVARFSEAALKNRWEVIFLTQRPSSAGDTAQRQSQAWLVRNGFAMPSVYVVNGSRGLIAASLGLDAVVDDRPENCLDVVADSQAKSILVWRDSPRTAPPGASRLRVETVFSFGEALDQLLALSVARRSVTAGLVGRMRQKLGL